MKSLGPKALLIAQVERDLQPAFLGKKDASRWTGLSVRVLDYARAAGDLNFYRVGAKVVYATSDLAKWMSRFRVDPADVEGESP